MPARVLHMYVITYIIRFIELLTKEIGSGVVIYYAIVSMCGDEINHRQHSIENFTIYRVLHLMIRH